MKNLSEYPYVSIDVETKGLRWWLPEEGIFGIALSTPDGNDYYFDIRRQPEGLEWLKAQRPKRIVNHNMKFDLHMLWSVGIEYDPAICDCTMIRASLIDEHLLSYSLDNIAKKYLGDTKIDDIYQKLADIFGGSATRNVQIKNLHRADPRLVAPYAKKDTRLAMELWEWQEKELERKKLKPIADFEFRLFPVIFEMERKGVRVDTKLANEAIKKLTVKIDNFQDQLNEEAGFECNPNPSSDIHKLFDPKKNDSDKWVANNGAALGMTATGKASINSEALHAMEDKKAELLINIRKLRRCRDTFLKRHILAHEHNGYLHPNINQVKGDSGGTGTGRFSYTKPALQQIPARDKEIAAIMRPIFIPDEGHIWTCWDYAQFEFRMFSHYVEDPDIIKMYKDNPKVDYHQMVADLTGLPRNAPMSGGPNAKQLNLSMIYDMGEASIARTLNLPLDPEVHTFVDKKGNEVVYYKAGPETKEIITKYHAAIPGVIQLYDKVKSVAKKRGHVISISGRHMRYPGGKGLNKAKAILCQGSSADCMKQKMLELHNYFKAEEPDCRMYLSVHDEVNIGIPKNHPNLLKVLRNIRYILETFDGKFCPIKLRVPIKTDFGIGHNWAQASGKGG